MLLQDFKRRFLYLIHLNLRPYVALSRKDREDRRPELLKSLDGLEAEIDNVAELVRGDKMGDFKAKAAFLRARFVEGL